MILIQKPRDVIGGLVVIAIGAGFFLSGQELEMGTSFRMGPGYFPTILSILMIGLGAVIAVQALRAPTTEHSFGQVPWRGLLLLIGAVLFFGFVVRGLGLAPAVLIVVLTTAWASRYASLRSSLPLSIGLAAFCAVLFIRLLGLPLPLTGPWLSVDYWSPAPPRHQPQNRQPHPGRRVSPMELLGDLGLGFATALSPFNLMYCFIGVLLGTAVGVLPGLGPVATIAMLLPITFGLPPVSSLIMLAGIYYGAQYGGSTTAILINLPGESSSVVTAIDGYQMAKKGRAGPALATAALGSFFAGTVATVLLAIAAPPLADVALQFGPAEYFSLMVLGLVASVALASGSLLKAFTMIVLGLLLGLVGSDVETGTQRFTFDMPEMADGLNFVALSMGVFGLGEILRNLEHEHTRSVMVKHVSGLMLSKADFKRIIGPVLRGTALGSLLGILPGGGAMLASFAAYTMEKKISPNRAEFGKGAIEGVAAPESANNAGAQTSFIPMLTLGIPSNPVMALMIGAMIIQGITPGPNVVTDEPELFWGMIVSMWVGNLMLVLLNLPLIGLWIRMLTIPYHLLFPAIIAFCCIGAFSVNNSVFDVFMMALFGLVGYALIKLDFEPAPLLLGFVLGPMLEENLRRAMLLSRGSPSVFVTHPLSLALLVISLALLIIVVMPNIRAKREEAFSE